MLAQGGEPLNEDNILTFSGAFVKSGWFWKRNLRVDKTSSFLVVLVVIQKVECFLICKRIFV